jgi:hypothetical protein
MIRRDYLLRQIEEFAAVLAKMLGLTKTEQWQEASAVAEDEFQRLAGLSGAEIIRLSETELFARLVRSEPTQIVETKIFMLATLLKGNGDVLIGQGRLEESRLYYLKGLHLLLEVFGRSEVTERPDFVPAVEAFLTGLSDAPLPLATRAMLMQHYERTGEFARAEDLLFTLLEAEPERIELLDFGTVFYRRLLGRSDSALTAGNLPRSEVQAGLAELDARRAGLRPE